MLPVCQLQGRHLQWAPGHGHGERHMPAACPALPARQRQPQQFCAASSAVEVQTAEEVSIMVCRLIASLADSLKSPQASCLSLRLLRLQSEGSLCRHLHQRAQSLTYKCD